MGLVAGHIPVFPDSPSDLLRWRVTLRPPQMAESPEIGEDERHWYTCRCERGLPPHQRPGDGPSHDIERVAEQPKGDPAADSFVTGGLSGTDRACAKYEIPDADRPDK
jgi:hypothetical protein